MQNNETEKTEEETKKTEQRKKHPLVLAIPCGCRLGLCSHEACSLMISLLAL